MLNKAISGVAGTLLVLLTTYVVAGHPDSTKWLAMAMASGIAAACWAARLTLLNEPLELDRLDAALAGLLAYIGLSSLWSPNQTSALMALIIGTAMWLLLVYLRHHATQRLLLSLSLSLIAGEFLIALLYQVYGEDYWGGYGNRGFLAEALPLCLTFYWVPWKAAKPLGKALLVIPFVATLIFLFQYSTSAIPVFISIALVAWVALRWSFRQNRWLGWGVLACGLGLPLLAAGLFWDALNLTKRLMIRIELSLDTLVMFRDYFLVGTGAGGFITLHPIYREAHLAWFNYMHPSFTSFNTEAEAAHQEILQFLAEFGVVGALLAGLAIWQAVRAWKDRFGRDAAVTAGVVGLFVLLVAAQLEYPLQRPTTLYLGTLALAFATYGRQDRLKPLNLRLPMLARLPLATVLLAAALSLGWGGFRQHLASVMAEVARNHPDKVEGLKLFYRSWEINPLNHLTQESLPICLSQVLQTRGVGSVPPATIERLFAIGLSGAPHNTGILLSLAQYLLETGQINTPRFRSVVAELHVGANYIAAVHLFDARLALVRGDKVTAEHELEEARRLNIGNPYSESVISVNNTIEILERIKAQTP